MSTASRTMTYADLEILPDQESGDRYEILDGELIVTPSPIPFHESLGIELTFLFVGFVKTHRLGRVFGDHVDIKLSETTVVIPDLCFVARHRLGIIGPRAIEGPPDLVLEIHSPSTRARDLGAKKALYARFGVPEYWAVDPETRTITVFALRDDRYEVVPPEGGSARSEVLPGFTLDVDALFTTADL